MNLHHVNVDKIQLSLSNQSSDELSNALKKMTSDDKSLKFIERNDSTLYYTTRRSGFSVRYRPKPGFYPRLIVKFNPSRNDVPSDFEIFRKLCDTLRCPADSFRITRLDLAINMEATRGYVSATVIKKPVADRKVETSRYFHRKERRDDDSFIFYDKGAHDPMNSQSINRYEPSKSGLSLYRLEKRLRPKKTLSLTDAFLDINGECSYLEELVDQFFGYFKRTLVIEEAEVKTYISTLNLPKQHLFNSFLEHEWQYDNVNTPLEAAIAFAYKDKKRNEPVSANSTRFWKMCTDMHQKSHYSRRILEAARREALVEVYRVVNMIYSQTGDRRFSV